MSTLALDRKPHFLTRFATFFRGEQSIFNWTENLLSRLAAGNLIPNNLAISRQPNPRSENLPDSVHQTSTSIQQNSQPSPAGSTDAITLILLHPVQSVPVQSWKFKDEKSVSIGRATDNDVILYSAVVSRHHLKVHRQENKWFLENLGVNGTYLDGERITKEAAVDGMVVRLATSGPKIQIRLGDLPTSLESSSYAQSQKERRGVDLNTETKSEEHNTMEG